MNRLSFLINKAQRIENDIKINKDLINTSIALISEYDDCDIDKASLHHKVSTCTIVDKCLNDTIIKVNNEITDLKGEHHE